MIEAMSKISGPSGPEEIEEKRVTKVYSLPFPFNSFHVHPILFLNNFLYLIFMNISLINKI